MAGPHTRLPFAVLDGIDVQEQASGIPGMAGYYRRLLVVCPTHTLCTKRRNFGMDTALSSGLGDLEPLAYLAVWFRARHGFDGPDATRRHCWTELPTLEQTLQYAEHELGWHRS